jgi:hypothetical protein
MSIVASLSSDISHHLGLLEMLRIILLTPVFLALLFLPAIISPRHTLSTGLLSLPLPLCGIAAGCEVLLPLIDKVLDVLCIARLQRVDVWVRGRVIARREHTV